MGHHVIRPRFALPLSAATAGLTAAHHGFELSSGIGLVGQPELGLRVTSLIWGLGLPSWAALAARTRPRPEALLALASGTALAGSLVHFILWPTRRTRSGLPVLIEAEGLPTASLPAYNAILYIWGGAAALSILLEVPRGARRWALLDHACAVHLRPAPLRLAQRAGRHKAGLVESGRPIVSTRWSRP